MRAPYADRNCWSVLKPLIPVLPFRYKNQRTGAAATVRMEVELLTYLAAVVILQKTCLLPSNRNRLFLLPTLFLQSFPLAFRLLRPSFAITTTLYLPPLARSTGGRAARRSRSSSGLSSPKILRGAMSNSRSGNFAARNCSHPAPSKPYRSAASRRSSLPPPTSAQNQT